MAVRIINADVLDGPAALPDESVHCAVTSPLFWMLRDYGTGTWQGGDPDCDHIASTICARASSSASTGRSTSRIAVPPAHGSWSTALRMVGLSTDGTGISNCRRKAADGVLNGGLAL